MATAGYHGQLDSGSQSCPLLQLQKDNWDHSAAWATPSPSKEDTGLHIYIKWPSAKTPQMVNFEGLALPTGCYTHYSISACVL
jgi:hypothetical protein